jgi:hypothetical protein
MKIRMIVPLLVLMNLISCSFLKGEQKLLPIKGSIIVSKYFIPVPSKLSFYVENELFQEVQTNEKGQFYFNVKKEYAETKGFVIVSPLKNAVIKDTLVTGTIISQVQAHDIEVDTFYFDSFKSISNLQLKKFQLMEINRVDSH